MCQLNRFNEAIFSTTRVCVQIVRETVSRSKFEWIFNLMALEGN